MSGGGEVGVKARGQAIKMKHRERAKCEIPQCYEIVWKTFIRSKFLPHIKYTNVIPYGVCIWEEEERCLGGKNWSNLLRIPNFSRH